MMGAHPNMVRSNQRHSKGCGSHAKMFQSLFEKSEELLRDLKTVQVVRVFAKLFVDVRMCSDGLVGLHQVFLRVMCTIGYGPLSSWSS
jgi:hypothetical protein